MIEDIPLVVPEVNAGALSGHTGIIANPNCSTIQMVTALQPIREKFGLDRIIVSTYQAVSGAGSEAIDELESQSLQFENRSKIEAAILPSASAERHYPIAFNAIPQIDAFDPSGYTLEELKMMNETKKIFGDQKLSVSATCVRLPVVTGHSESVYIEIGKEGVSVEELHAYLKMHQASSSKTIHLNNCIRCHYLQKEKTKCLWAVFEKTQNTQQDSICGLYRTIS